ncbi:MAG: hypothetical protein IKJ58_10685, partial [Akkermansia sp.]|nr:hypothetical protein [Akkermansia sp.]
MLAILALYTKSKAVASIKITRNQRLIRVPKIWDTLIYELQFTIYELKVSGLRRYWDKRKIVPMNGLYDTRP